MVRIMIISNIPKGNSLSYHFYTINFIHLNDHVYFLRTRVFTGPMQEFFQEIEELRGIIGHVEQDIQRVKQVQNDILSCPQVDQKAKQQLDDLMNDIKKKANSGLYLGYQKNYSNTILLLPLTTYIVILR